jgi:hypothetical protein
MPVFTITANSHPLTLNTASAGNTITSCEKSTLNIADIEVVANIFKNDDLANSLVSVNDFTSNDYTVSFDKLGVSILNKDGSTRKRFPKDERNKLWTIQADDDKTVYTSQTTRKPQINSAIRNALNAEFVSYAHAALGSPPPSTLYRALLKGWLSNFPRLTAKMLYQNWPNSLATAQGHLQLKRQGIRSTQPKPHERTLLKPEPTDTDFHTETDNVNDDVVQIKCFSRIDAMHADASGRYPVPSYDKHEYQMIFVYKNYVHVELMVDRSSTSYVSAFSAAIEFFKSASHPIRNIVMDNETSEPLKQFIGTLDILCQRVPAGDKRSNKAERAIQSWRHHYLSTLGTVSEHFPHQCWHKLVQQIELTLSMLRPYADNTDISSYEGLFGKKYDFDAHPISIAGCAAYVFEPPKLRQTWSTHGVSGFYLGPALDSYRAYRCWITPTSAERTSNTIQLFPENFVLPGASKEEMVIKALNNLTEAVQLRNEPHLDLAVDAALQLVHAINLEQYMPRQPNEPDGVQPTQNPHPQQGVRANEIPDAPAINPLQTRNKKRSKKKSSYRQATPSEQMSPTFRQ